jgi:hypothetical protein
LIKPNADQNCKQWNKWRKDAHSGGIPLFFSRHQLVRSLREVPPFEQIVVSMSLGDNGFQDAEHWSGHGDNLL